MVAVESYLLLTLVWTSWCVVHSLMICIPVTNYLETQLGIHFRFYRFAYNLIAITTLALPLLLSLYMQQNETVLFGWSGIFVMLRFFLIGIALTLFVSGARQYSMASFLGISQFRSRRSHHLLSDQSAFNVSGISAVTRHPWYLGGIIITWSAPGVFFPSTVVTALIVTGYFLVGTVLEERKLVTYFGDSYRDYQQQVSMLFPVKWSKTLFLKNNKRGE